MTDNPVVNLARKADLFSAAPARPLIQTSPLIVYMAKLAPSSRRVVAQRLRHACEIAGLAQPQDLDWSTLRAQHVDAMRSLMLAAGVSPGTCNATLSAVKGVGKAAFRLGLITGDDWIRSKETGPAKGSRLPQGQALKDEDRAIAIPEWFSVRDRAILLVLRDAGLRRDEVARMDMAGLDMDARHLTIIGKGNKQRRVPLSDELHAGLVAWLKVRGQAPGPAFCRVTEQGTLTPDMHALSAQTIFSIVKRTGQDLSPHSFRRGFASVLLRRGASLPVISRLMGHSSVQTTALYMRDLEDDAKAAIALLNGPGKPENKTE